MTLPLRPDTADKGSTKKYSELIVDALSNLQDKQGTDVKRITEFVANREMIPENEAKKMVQTTLHRGIQFGAIEKKPGGLYALSVPFANFLRQHRCCIKRRRRRRSCGRVRRRRPCGKVRRRRSCVRRRRSCGRRRRRQKCFSKCSKRRFRRRRKCKRKCRRRFKRGDRRKWKCRSDSRVKDEED